MFAAGFGVADDDRHGARQELVRLADVGRARSGSCPSTQILEVAVEYGLIAANPAKGRRRRLKAQKATPVWLDRTEHIEALLDAAGELDRHALVKGGHDQRGGQTHRRALLATLVFAGLRIGELTALRWRDVDLAGNRITVRASKTDAGVRQIDLLPALRDELAAYKVQALSTTPNGYVFATLAGTEPKQGNIRRRVLDKAVEKANEKLTKQETCRCRMG
jgi:integrase